jgi:hypothetical protein
MLSDPREPLGRFAYETWWGEDHPIAYPSWETLHPAQQDGWCRAAQALYDAGFQAGADSVTHV